MEKGKVYIVKAGNSWFVIIDHVAVSDSFDNEFDALLWSCGLLL